MFVRISVLVLVLTVAFVACDTTNPPSNKKLTIDFADASCTEAWLNLSVENIALPTEISIKQDDSTVAETMLNSKDTTLYVDNLLPKENYNFEVVSSQAKSNGLEVSTMDTTSHDFTWETFIFGDRNSVLKDVAIIDENNIWAVGEIHTEETDQFDSNGVWVQPYNAVHWDGVNWELKRIMFYTFCNQEHKAPYSASATFSFSDSSVAITSGSQISFVKDGKQKGIECIPVSVNSIWGTSSQDFYVVGNGGNIAHYNGSIWEKIDSGTEEDLYDIYGVDNRVYIAGGSYVNSVGVLLKGDITGFNIIKEGTYEYVDTVFSPYFVGSISTLWLTSTNTLYFGGDALYKNKNNSWDFDRTLEGNCLRCNGGGKYYSSITKIRGNDGNDMVLVGLTNTVRHFNGVSWKQLGEAYDPNLATLLWWYSVSMNNNEIIAVGEKGNQAIVRRFKR